MDNKNTAEKLIDKLNNDFKTIDFSVNLVGDYHSDSTEFMISIFDKKKSFSTTVYVYYDQIIDDYYIDAKNIDRESISTIISVLNDFTTEMKKKLYVTDFQTGSYYICPKCHKKINIRDNIIDNFCPKCGYKLEVPDSYKCSLPCKNDLGDID